MVEVVGAGGGVVGVVVVVGTVVVKPLSKASDSGSVYNKVSTLFHLINVHLFKLTLGAGAGGGT